MLALDETARAALEGSHLPGYRVSAYYGAELTLADVPITKDGSLSFDGDQDVQGGGSAFVVRDGADSLVPKTMLDILAPFGQELSIERTITQGAHTWAIPLGRFRISSVPSASDSFRRSGTKSVRVGSSVKLELKDRFEIIQADDFVATTSPIYSSTWDEIRRLSPIPIVQSLADRPLPSGLVYKSRAEALTQLIANLGGVPHMTRTGALTARKADAWLTETTPVFTIGGVVELDDGMSNALYNSVVVTTSQDPNILAVAEITDATNPLAVSRPIGRRTYAYSDPLITTQAQANAAAQTVLARVSTRQSQVAKVKCLPRPDLELGDYGVAVDEISGRKVYGEISTMSFSLDPYALMDLSLIVSEVIA